MRRCTYMSVSKRRLRFWLCFLVVILVCGKLYNTEFLLLRFGRLAKKIFWEVNFGLNSFRSCDRSLNHLSLDKNGSVVCGFKECGQEYLARHGKMFRIPPIRHILWKSHKMPYRFAKHLKTWIDIHPNWTYILWRDVDLEPFVRKHYPKEVWEKYNSLPTSGPNYIKRMDMVRYLIMYKFGGVYADADYILNASLNAYRHYPNVVTREPEASSIINYGFQYWPLPIVANAALFMTEPRSKFMQFCIEQIMRRCAYVELLAFAGPYALSHFLQAYSQSPPPPPNFVYIPPSYPFSPFLNNRLESNPSAHRLIYELLLLHCYEAKSLAGGQPLTAAVVNYCKNVKNFDPLTDRSEAIVAIHDLNKTGSTYNAGGDAKFHEVIDVTEQFASYVQLASKFL